MKFKAQLFLFILLNTLHGQVDYTSQIQTIFSSDCTGCHGNSGGLNLTSYSNLMAGGNSGAVIVANDHANSLLWQKVNTGEMPQNNPALPQSQIDLIALWINEGALEFPAVVEKTYVPDDNFEQALIDLGYDDVIDDSVLTANISGVTTLNVSNDSISDLTGIEDFTALTNLNCRGNQLTSLDVSSNTALTELTCYANALDSLDVSSNTALTELHCSNNQLTSLDVSSNTVLTFLDCGGNALDSLDVSNNTALTFLNCGGNALDSLDVSSNTALTNLSCDWNQLTSLNVSNNTTLTELACNNNQLTNLDVSNNTALTKLNCDTNQLISLDVSNNTALTRLDCYHNDLTNLDVTNNVNLTRLNTYGNALDTLDVSNNVDLTYLTCVGLQSSNLDVSNNIALSTLNCHTSQLTSLDVSNNTDLTYLNCRANQLDSLDVSNNTALTDLRCQQNGLTYLNMRNGVTDALTYFQAEDNSLTCIETLDPDYATANWTYANGNIDEGVTFAVDCTPGPPTLVINEILAYNNACCTDANGDYDSYLELYNYGDEEVDIGGMVITDNLNNYDNYYQIPTANDSTIIQPSGFLLLWTDKESEQGVLHLEIELLSRGGEVGLFMSDSTTVVDTLIFVAQSADTAYGRYPDNSTTWQLMDPTPGSTNIGGLSINDNIVIPSRYTLHQNYPNPFNPVTTLRYELPEKATVNITIYDMLGREIKTLINQTQGAGYKSAIWDATNDYGKPVTAGIYIYQIQAVGFIQTKKMVLLK